MREEHKPDRIRRYIRHPSSVPIDVRPLAGDPPAVGEPISDIGLGGLAFLAPRDLRPGTRVQVRIPIIDPQFDTHGEVVWSRPRGDRYEVGIRFVEPADLYTLRMVEQICHIEHYRQEVERREGRALSSDQAAAEWIRLYADVFPEFRPPH